MRIRLDLRPPATVTAHWLVVGVHEGQPEPPAALASTPIAGKIRALLASKEVAGTPGETVAIYGADEGAIAAGALLLVGLGRREAFDAGAADAAGVAVGRKLGGKARDSVALAVPEAGVAPARVSALVEGIVVGTRGPDLRKSEPVRHPFGELIVAIDPAGVDPAELEAAVRRGEVVGRAVNFARDLANAPPAEKPPGLLAERIGDEARAAGLGVAIWDEARIRRERFGGLLGVAAGSDRPPAFVVLDHRGGGDGPVLALVGKGVTFDSGGLSLKPSASMEDMKADMTGAAVVASAMAAASRLKLPINLAGYLPITENMTGGRAMKLGDVLTMRNGKTVEVMNTDAEGRLILADALSYAAEHSPSRIIDLATLTGACIVALGTKVAGLFANDDPIAEAILAACRRTGERAWRLPLDDDYREALKSPVADLKNVGGKWGGAVTAAKFLEEFVGKAPWAHLDIAGPSWADGESSTRDAGATGCFVRTLVDLFEHQDGG